MRFSIIVPIYNVADYLETCIESVIQQDFTDYEIILVNDGSPDRCKEICDQYITQNKNIRVIHKENGGVSSARNAGLMVAQGDYVLFLDGDDFAFSRTMVDLAIHIDHQPGRDLYLGNYASYYDSTHVIEPVTFSIAPEHVENANSFEVLRLLFLHNEQLMDISRYAFRRQVIISRGLTFSTEYQAGEDADFLFRFILAANSFAIVPCMFYHYRLGRPGSIMTNMNPEALLANLHVRKTWYDTFNQLMPAHDSLPIRRYLANAFFDCLFYISDLDKPNRQLCIEYMAANRYLAADVGGNFKYRCLSLILNTKLNISNIKIAAWLYKTNAVVRRVLQNQ